MLKKLSLLLLYLTAFLICLPILLVLLGSLKSTQELMGSLSPILGDSNGMVNWSPFPLYPTLNHFYKLLFYSFFLYCFLEFHENSILYFGRPIVYLTSCCLGLCLLFLSFKKTFIYIIYYSYAYAIPSNYAVQLSCS